MARETIVDTTPGSNYPTITGTPFQDFNVATEFIDKLNETFPGLFDFAILKYKKHGNYLTGALLKCSFKTNPGSVFFFYVNTFQNYSGHDDQLRCQPRGITKWQPSGKVVDYAQKFQDARENDLSLENKECYCIGLYKQNARSEDILFVGMPPYRIISMEKDPGNSSSTSQISIYDIQKAYRKGMHLIYNDSKNLFAFKPRYLLWYMMKRDTIHEQILIEKNKEFYPASETELKGFSLQEIFYGAPGTGKSKKINDITKRYSFIRTTFHPECDYASFVGSYKPTVEKGTLSADEITKLKAANVSDETISKVTSSKISYKFSKQAFLKSYVTAWRLFQGASKEQCPPHFLIIEEINRGNCAQIFGDIFQLLDRKNGFSEYPIEADEEITKSLCSKNDEYSFGEDGLNLSDEQKSYINSIYKKNETDISDIANLICKGKVLALPCNLYIWATMNTSDQSLFPMDSAFKRRWNWEYKPISKPQDLDWQIEFRYKNQSEQETDIYVKESWWNFVTALNKIIARNISIESKKIGFFFCQGENGLISPELFVNKVVFYLWNELYKDDDSNNSPFLLDGRKRSFDDFFLSDSDKPEINLHLTNLFLQRVLSLSQE